MATTPLLSLPAHLSVGSISSTTAGLLISLFATLDTALCPACATPSTRVRSSYERTVADVPCGGQCVTFRLRVRRFVCRNTACPQRIFAEQFPPWLQPRARQTERRREVIVALGLATSGAQAARLAKHLQMPSSATTITRSIMALPPPLAPPVETAGIDDFALRRGHHYGTIVVDLVRRRVVDLLPDREVASTSSWLRDHPTVNRVSRDRAGAYAEGIRQSGRDIIQIADRWHVLANLGAAIEHIAARLGWGALLAASQAGEQEQTTSARAVLLTPALPLSLPQQERRAAIVELHAHGLSIRQIAVQVQVARGTVRRYLRGYGAQRPRAKRRSLLDPFRHVIYERWQAGADAMQIYREICGQGYQGKPSIVRQLVGTWRKEAPPSPPVPQLPARQIRWILTRMTERLSEQEREQRLLLLAASPEARIAFGCYHRFWAMLRQHRASSLTAWLDQAEASGFPELRAFVAGVYRDLPAVINGLQSSFSQGPVEGQITKLKLIKRQMYGKAGVPLLRQRLLHPV